MNKLEVAPPKKVAERGKLVDTARMTARAALVQMIFLLRTR